METIRYSDADLQEFKVLIESKLEKARTELDYLQEQIVEITENSDSDYGGDWMDDSSTTNDVEMLNNMAIRQRKYIRDLENALLRVQNKTYGICMVSGQLIDKKRLLAVPTATKSLEAKLAEQTSEKKAGRATRSEDDQEEAAAPAPASTERKPKVITKIIRKSGAAKPSRDLDEEFDEIFGKDMDESDEDVDSSDDVNLDEIADDDSSFD
jgi:RNA polymerase-binding transcription factor DksA